MTKTNFFSFCQEKLITNKRFLVDLKQSREFSYADFLRITGSMATWLREQSFDNGDRVMVQVEKSAENLLWYFATLRAGLTYLPLNTAYQPDELSYFIANAKPSLIICDPIKIDLFKQLADCQIETLSAEGTFSQEIPETEEFQDVDVEKDDIAVILYTSGTTGKPKGAMISHANLISNSSSLSAAWDWQTDDVMLHALPIFHIHGLFIASHLAVMNSSTLLFLDKFSPQTVINNLPLATVYMGVPTNYTRLLADTAFNHDACRNMRLFTSGSAPLLTQTFAQMKSQTGFEIVERYGMTETGMNTSNPLRGSRKPGTVGLPLKGIEAKVVNDQGDRVTTNEPGNLLIRGSNVFRGYWQMPDKTAEDFTQDGFFKTGDIASIDSDGYVSIVGRNKDMVITGGLNVYPKEIESIIDNVPGVNESAVIGLPDSDFGEAVTAIVVTEDSATDEDDCKTVIADALASLASFKRPKQVHFVDELPRNTMGKVQKNVLREKYTDPSSS